MSMAIPWDFQQIPAAFLKMPIISLYNPTEFDDISAEFLAESKADFLADLQTDLKTEFRADLNSVSSKFASSNST